MMQASANLAASVAWCGFALGCVFGAVGHKTHFCAMGAVSDVMSMGDWGRMRMWLLAIAVAALGANTLQVLGYVDLSKSIYQTPDFNWLGYVLGGLLFGAGMTLSSGCGSRTLIRLGGGNLKSLVVFVFLAISSYMTLKGLFGIWRVSYIQPASVVFTSGQDLPSLFAAATGLDKKILQIFLTLLITGGLLAFIFANRDFRHNGEKILGGIIIGLVVAAGWYVTGYMGYAENPETLEMTFLGTNNHAAESLTFVAPLAYTLELLMLWSDSSLHVSFGVAAVLGVIAGSFAYALASRNFRVESFRDGQDTANHM
ncbi:MAG: YeeE/YedE family protein, partial [Burkholderiales bacterium]